VELKQINKE